MTRRNNQRFDANQKGLRIRINTVITGEPAHWLDDWKRRGLVTSYTDAVVQTLRVFKEKITEQDLRLVQLKNMKNIRENW